MYPSLQFLFQQALAGSKQDNSTLLLMPTIFRGTPRNLLGQTRKVLSPKSLRSVAVPTPNKICLVHLLWDFEDGIELGAIGKKKRHLWLPPYSRKIK